MKRHILLFIFLVGFLSVTLASNKKVLIDDYHSGGFKSAEEEFSILIEFKGYDFDFLEEEITFEKIKDYDIFIIWSPLISFKDSEIQAIIKFVEKGGGLILTGERDLFWEEEARESLNMLSKNFGVRFMDNAVDDQVLKAGCHCTPVIQNIQEHEITRDISQIVVFSACSIDVKNAEKLLLGNESTKTEGNEVLEGEEIVVAAAREYGRGRIVFLGSHYIFQDKFIEKFDNKKFVENMLSWVSSEKNAGLGFEAFLLFFLIVFLYKLNF